MQKPERIRMARLKKKNLGFHKGTKEFEGGGGLPRGVGDHQKPQNNGHTWRAKPWWPNKKRKPGGEVKKKKYMKKKKGGKKGQECMTKN